MGRVILQYCNLTNMPPNQQGVAKAVEHKLVIAIDVLCNVPGTAGHDVELEVVFFY